MKQLLVLAGLLLGFCAPAAAQQLVPGQETLRRLIESMQQGHTDLNLLDGGDVKLFGGRHADFESMLESWGPLKSVTYRLTSVHRFLVFDVRFEQAASIWKITTITPDGRIGGIDFWRYDVGRQPVVKTARCSNANAISGAMMWTADVIAADKFYCMTGRGTGGPITRSYGGFDWNSAVEGQDLKVSLNILFKNPADAARIKTWTRAKVTGQFVWHDEFWPQSASMRSNGFNETEYLTIQDAEIEQDPSEAPVSGALSPSVFGSPAPLVARPAEPPPADPKTEVALRHLIGTIAAGKPDYAAMTPDQAEHLQHVRAGLAATLRDLGPIKSVTLLDKNSDGALIYGVAFEHGANQFAIRLGSGGLIETLSYGPRLTLSSATPIDPGQAPP